MRYLLILLLTLSLPQMGWAQLTPVWNHAYGTSLDERQGYAVAMPTGGYLLLSEISYPGSPPVSFNRFLYFVRTNTLGDTLWTKRMVPLRTTQPSPTGLAVDPTGNVLVTGWENGGNGYGFMLKLTPTCDTLWTRRNHYIGPGNSLAIQQSPLFTADGNYAVLESTVLFGLGAPIYNFSLLKVSAINGNPLWNHSFASDFIANGFGVTSYISSVAKTPIGFLATGRGINANYSVLTLAIDNNGTLVQVKKRLDNSPNAGPVAFSTADGNVVVGQRQMATKLTPLGDTLWHTAVPPRLGRNWDAASLCEDAQGNVVVAGNSSFLIGSGLYADNVHLTRFRRQTGQVVNDTMLFRPGQTYASTVLRTATGRLVIGGWFNNGPYGGSDAFLAEWSAFRPLAARAGASPLAAGVQVYPNPAGAGGATLRLPEASRAGGTLAVFDAAGRRCAQQAVAPGAAAVAVPLAGLPPGLYLLRFETTSGARFSTRLVRE